MRQTKLKKIQPKKIPMSVNKQHTLAFLMTNMYRENFEAAQDKISKTDSALTDMEAQLRSKEELLVFYDAQVQRRNEELDQLTRDRVRLTNDYGRLAQELWVTRQLNATLLRRGRKLRKSNERYLEEIRAMDRNVYERIILHEETETENEEEERRDSNDDENALLLAQLST